MGSSELTNFTSYMPRKHRCRKIGCSITREYLQHVWCTQNGLCAITNLPMHHPKTKDILTDPLLLASLDRIDNTEGYVEGNVQFVIQHINLMRNTLTIPETHRLLDLISSSTL